MIQQSTYNKDRLSRLYVDCDLQMFVFIY